MLDHRQRLPFHVSYEDTISVENLLEAWTEFVAGKRGKEDVQEFQTRFMHNILALHEDLATGRYQHGGYFPFKISDPKPRDIHKALIRDRLLHHAVYRKLYMLFDRTWIADSYSCRDRKGTHLAMNRFKEFAFKVSQNHTRTCWVLKCDIRKFFASIDHKILLNIVSGFIQEPQMFALIAEIVGSFNSTTLGKGLPLGNLTSQLLVNVYMNEFDQFAKHQIKATHYIRYADDFVMLSASKEHLEQMLPHVSDFLSKHLALSLHPNKVSISTISSGIDFLGWVHFQDHRVLRTSTKRRMLRNLKQERTEARVVSYRGMLSHGNAKHLMLGV